MRTGFRGTFVISWSQTEIDGLAAAPPAHIDVGVAWRCRGDVVRVDGPSDVLRLDMAEGEADLRRRAAQSVRRLVGAAVQNRSDIHAIPVDIPLMEQSFTLTDGLRTFTASLIEVPGSHHPLLMFVDEIPPRDQTLWVVHHSLGSIRVPRSDPAPGVICFARGSRIATPDGARAIEQLREGDLVLTRDNGPRPILWIGTRRITGARFQVMPALRPIRIRAGALGDDGAGGDLLVSPDHRLLLRGDNARALFNTPEVLVRARDLLNGVSVQIDHAVPEVTYMHLLLDGHQVIWASGHETESFHPASAALDSLDCADRDRLIRQCPDVATDPAAYGAYARRLLTRPEAALLTHRAA